jgi:hypothetical protein
LEKLRADFALTLEVKASKRSLERVVARVRGADRWSDRGGRGLRKRVPSWLVQYEEPGHAVKRESLLPQFLRFGRIVGHEREEQIRRAKLSAGEKHHARKVNEANS